MIQSPTLKYGSKDWEAPKDKTYSSSFYIDPTDNEDPDIIELSYFSYWKKYNADNDIDLSVFINTQLG